MYSIKEISKLVEKPWFLCGLEKEGLRIDTNANISSRPHFKELGAKLTHPFITTDFAESQLELITPPCESTKSMLEHLDRTHSFVLSNINDELIWPGSMPCTLPDDIDIEIADFGKSFIGQAKRIYRSGLAHRYGKKMQMVSGVHFNISFSSDFWNNLGVILGEKPNQSFIDEQYFSLIRNYKRYSWVISLLLGSSPCFDESFLLERGDKNISDYLSLGNKTRTSAGATCLRMTDIGYISQYQNNIKLAFNSLKEYTNSIRKALQIPVNKFSEIPMTDKAGLYSQLNNHLLQIENEYYSQIRPKRNTADLLRPVVALERDGVEYIEIRNLDVNPFYSCGIDLQSADFIVLFILWCITQPSPCTSIDASNKDSNNFIKASESGRLNDTIIDLGNDEQPISKQITIVLDSINTLAEKLEKLGQPQYKKALEKIVFQLNNGDLPSQKVENICKENNQGLVSAFLSLAKKHKNTSAPLTKEYVEQYQLLTKKSLQQQIDIEIHDKNSSKSFSKFLEDYLSL